MNKKVTVVTVEPAGKAPFVLKLHADEANTSIS